MLLSKMQFQQHTAQNCMYISQKGIFCNLPEASQNLIKHVQYNKRTYHTGMYHKTMSFSQGYILETFPTGRLIRVLNLEHDD